MKIRAALTCGPDSPFEYTELDLDDVRPDEILVRTVAVGMCHSDLTARAFFPDGAVLGHEGAGVVEAVGAEVVGFAPGDHVVLSFDSCRRCKQCLRGRPYRCRDFSAMNYGGVRPDGTSTLRLDSAPIGGAFFGQSSMAGFCLASGRNAVKVDPDLPLDVLAPLGCGVITGAGTVMNALQPKSTDSLAVFGVGAVGLSALLGAVTCRVDTLIAVDINPRRLTLAAALGATHTIDARSSGVAERIREITSGGVDYVVECSGNATAVANALASVPEGGTVATVGLAELTQTVTVPHYELMMGRTLMGVTEGNSIPQLFIPELIALWRRGMFPFDKMIKHYRFDEANQAAADSLAGTTIKPVLMI